MAVGGLLDEIEADVASSKPLADTLRKCVILGGQAGSVGLRDWAVRELRGYDDTDVPAYRKLVAGIYVDGRVGPRNVRQRIGAHQLPAELREHISEQVPMPQGVGALEALIAQAQAADEGELQLSLPGAPALAAIFDQGQPFQETRAVYWSVPVAALVAIVDQVRTTLAELVAEMRAGLPRGEEQPSADVADHAVSVAVHGNRSRVIVTTAQASGSASATVQTEQQTETGWFTMGRRIGAAVVGVATVVAAVISYLEWIR